MLTQEDYLDDTRAARERRFLKDIAQALGGHLSYRELLTEALTCERQGRRQKGTETRLAHARLPSIKSLEQFDFAFQPSIERKVIRALTTLGFVDRAENIALLSPLGVGKTYLAIALAAKAAQTGHRIVFLTLGQLIGKIPGFISDQVKELRGRRDATFIEFNEVIGEEVVSLDGLTREGAMRMLEAALRAEVA